MKYNSEHLGKGWQAEAQFWLMCSACRKDLLQSLPGTAGWCTWSAASGPWAHPPSWRFVCQLQGNASEGSPFHLWPWTRAPRQCCGDTPARADPLPRGDAFKLSNYQLAHAVPWHISLERKMTKFVSRNLFLSVIASEGFLLFFFLKKRPITFSINCKGKTALSLLSYKC